MKHAPESISQHELLHLLRKAKVGDRVKFDEEAQRYTIQARDDRYLVCTKPFNARRTVLYSIVDLQEMKRGPDNMLFGGGYETRQDCEERLADLNLAKFPMELSYRRSIPLNVLEVLA